MKNQFPVLPPQLYIPPDYNLLAIDVCDRFPDKVELYRQDKTALRFLLGVIMKETRGCANPGLVSSALEKELERRIL
jgi:Asp-tRNA(Asn)/Glu-tRNA(Gln) amidotransferase B subunit